MGVPDILSSDQLGGPDPGATAPASFTDDTTDAPVVTPAPSANTPPVAAPAPQTPAAPAPIQNGPGVWDSIRQALPLVMAGIAARAGGPLAGAGLLKGLSDAQAEKRAELEKQAALHQAYTHQNTDDLIRLQQESAAQQQRQTAFVQNAIKELNGIDDPVQFAATAKLFDDTSARVFGTDPGTISSAVKFDNAKALAKTKVDAQTVLDRVGKQFASPDDPTGAQFIAAHPDYTVTFRGKPTKFSDLQAVVGVDVSDSSGKSVAPTAQPALVDASKNPGQAAIVAEQQRRKTAGLPPMTQAEATKIAQDATANYEATVAGKRAAAEAANKPASGSNSISLDPDALDRAAAAFNRGAGLPGFGMGGKADKAAIMNRAAARVRAGLDQDVDIASAQAGFRADSGSLTQLQKNLDAVSAFEDTAFKNADQFIAAAQKVIDSGSPLANQPLRTLSDKVVGAPQVPTYQAARQVFANEIAKITSNPTLSGQLSDRSREEVAGYLPENATLKQTLDVVKLLKQDADNRRTALQDQITKVKGRISGGGGRAGGAGAGGGASAVPVNTRGTINGVPVWWDGKGWRGDMQNAPALGSGGGD